MPNHIPAPGSRLPQKEPELLALEAFMVERINGARSVHDRSMLRSDPLLAAVARAHSGEMRDLNYFAHESPTMELRDPSDRYVLAFGVKSSYLAENIFKGHCRAWFSPDDLLEHTVRKWLKAPLKPDREDIEQAHQGFMNSPGHHANIMLPYVTRVGVGLIHERGDIWITQMFAR